MMLTPERWTQVQAVFHQVVDLPKPQREAVLAGLCESDEALACAVREL